MTLTVYPSTDISDSPDLAVLNLSRLCARLELNLLSPAADLKPLGRSEYQRMRVKANLEYARTLLLQIERALPQIKPLEHRHDIQTDLTQKKQTLRLLTETLERINADAEVRAAERAETTGEEVHDEDDSEEEIEDLLATPEGESASEDQDAERTHERAPVSAHGHDQTHMSPSSETRSNVNVPPPPPASRSETETDIDDQEHIPTPSESSSLSRSTSRVQGHESDEDLQLQLRAPQHPPPSSQTGTLRNRLPQPAATATATSTATATATGSFTSRPTPSSTTTTTKPAPSLFNNNDSYNNKSLSASQSKLQTTEESLSGHRREQEDLTSSLLSLATQLKASSQAFHSTIEAEKSVLDRAVHGLDKTTTSMEAAERRMGMLRWMTEGKGWWGRMMLYAWIFGLWIVAVLIVFLGPKLRF